MPALVVIRGGGDLASGTAIRLFRAGLTPLITELPQPLAVRRSVSFAQAVFAGSITIEGVTGRLANDLQQALEIVSVREIPVLVDPQAGILQQLHRTAVPAARIILVDGRLLKDPGGEARPPADLVIGLGPGHMPGKNCDAVVETMRGHFLGHVLWHAPAQADTGIPDVVSGRGEERVLRAPADGNLASLAEIGQLLEKDQPVALVSGQIVRAPFPGVLRGLLYHGLAVYKGMKIGDIDPRLEPRFCQAVSDKSLAVGGGVLEAILSRADLRPYLWE